MHSHVGAARRGSALDMIASLQALTSGLNSPQGAADDASPFNVASQAGAAASMTDAGCGAPSAAPDSLFDKLDPNGDGSVDPGELASALQTKGAKGHHHHHHLGGASSAGAASTGGGADDLLGAGNTGQTVTNSDGSTTTTLSYADGSQITMTRPAAGSAGTSAAANNFLERIIQHQAQLLASQTTGQ